MARIIVFIVAAAVIFVLLWLLLWSVIHALLIGFWAVIVVLLAFAMFRAGRWSRSRARR
jgi:hypothetical protein